MLGEKQEIEIEATDQHILKASVFYPKTTQSNCIIVNSATGVKRRIYIALAEYLASEGFVVVIYDYRGIGDSLHGNVKACDAYMYEWGQKDFESIIQWVQKNVKPEKIFVLGHSIGGQIIGLAQSSQYINAIITVASQSGHWRYWDGKHKYLVLLMWYFLIPVLTRLLGFFPAKSLSFGENLPKGIALQWASWARKRHYILDDHKISFEKYFDKIHAPMLAIGITDDWIAPIPAIRKMITWYKNSQVTLEVVKPGDLNQLDLGHFKWLKADVGMPLWRNIISWCDQHKSS